MFWELIWDSGDFSLISIGRKTLQRLKTDPFHFDNWMLSLVRWEPIVQTNYPSRICFWVLVIGVPLHFWAEPTFWSIGEAIGQIQSEGDIDVNEGRVRVALDGFKPLVFSITVEFHGGEETTLALRYEKLHRFCRQCASLTYDQSRCPTKGSGNEINTEEQKHGGCQVPPSYKIALESEGKGQGLDKRQKEKITQDAKVRPYREGDFARERGPYYKQDQTSHVNGGRRFGNLREGTKRERHAISDQVKEPIPEYAVNVAGLNNCETVVGQHLDDHQRLMLDAFNTDKEPKSSSKARKSLTFDEEDTVRSIEDFVIPENVVPDSKVNENILDSTHDSAEMEVETEHTVHHTGEDTNRVFESGEIEEVRQENPIPKRKVIKPGTLAIAGNSRKRLVQSLISPRKKTVAKSMHKLGDKDPCPVKNNPLVEGSENK